MRKYRWSVLFILFLILGNMAVWPSAASLPSEVATAEEWLKANAASLPEHWDDMARVPFPIRKHVLRGLSPDGKKAIWKDGLRRFLENRSLTDQQLTLMARVDAAVVAAIDGVSAPRSSVCSDIGATFSSENDRLAFSEIAMPGPRTHSSRRTGIQSWLQSLYEPWVVVARAPVRESAMHPDCDCIYETECSQCNGQGCMCGECAYVTEWPFCGCAYIFACEGICGQCGPLSVPPCY
jgi:hypothetical protein